VDFSATELVDRKLVAVTIARYLFAAESDPVPLRFWLQLDDDLSVAITTPGSGALGLRLDRPHEDQDMAEYGRVVVQLAEAEFPLTAYVGERIRTVQHLWQEPPGMEVGLVLGFTPGAVGIANLSDELWVMDWPAPDWEQNGVRLMD
jgi:hypothetical protein